MIRHVLVIKFNANASVAEINEVKAGFESMPIKIEGVHSVEWGENNSPEGLNKGYTHMVLMNFDGQNGRDNYLPHPDHSELKKLFIPILEDIIVFDYTV